MSPEDRDGIVEVGAALEELREQLPAGNAELQEYVLVALGALQALFTGSAKEAATVGSVRDAVLAMVANLAAVDGQEAAAEPAEEGPEEEPEEAEAPAAEEAVADEPGAGGPPAMTLDGVAALLVQADAGDPAGMEELAAALRSAAGAAVPESLAGALALAAQEVAAVAQGDCPDPAAVLQGVGRLLAVASGDESELEAEAFAEPAAQEEPDGGDTGMTAWADALPAELDRDLLSEFIVEAREDITSAEAGLLSLETNGEDDGAVNTVFRAFHTLKGTAAFLGLTAISELSHRAESLLSRARDGEIRLEGGYADLALRSADVLKELVQSLQDGLGGEPLLCPPGLVKLMSDLADPEAAGISGQADTRPDCPAIEVASPAAETGARAAEEAALTLPPPVVVGGGSLLRAESAGAADPSRGGRVQKRPQGGESSQDSSVRVRTDRLDKLIEMVGELVIAHSMISQDATVQDQLRHELAKKVARTGKIVRELQDLTMSMRMVPLKATFQKMARLARDVAHKSHKEATFATEGEDTEIDRNMVDLVSDPLVHMVRNAIDHGLEAPDDREAAGKARSGRVVLSAYHAGGNVVLELSDDGRGLARDAIVAKALSRGIIESDKGMSDNDVFNLIFLPGFSTAERVTEVSGRGVGLDVVKRNVEALRGRIEITSEPGEGSTFMIRLPLTLAVTDGMLVRVGPERYIIPTLSIDMTFQPSRENLFTVAGKGELVMVRDQLMPMIRLHGLFGVGDAAQDPADALLVVLTDGARRYAVLVDELLGQQQVVAKPLGDGLAKVPGVSGGAILGDGRVGLILDPGSLSSLARRAVPQLA